MVKFFLRRSLVIIGILSVLVACSSLSSQLSEGTLIVINANVITGEGLDVLENHAVIIENDEIIAIQRMEDVGEIEGFDIIDAKNGYLVPGFIDTHAHVGVGPVSVKMDEKLPVPFMTPSESIADRTLEALLKHGITTARDPGGDINTIVSAKRRVEDGVISGPQLFVAGDIIDTVRFDNLTVSVRTADQVRAEVRRQVKTGVDWIKLYTGLSKDLVAAGIDEAHQQGVKVTGHLQNTNWTDAAKLGIDSLVHIIPGAKELLATDKHAEYEASILSGKAILKWFELADYESTQITEMIASLHENNVSVDPTLVVFHAMAFGDQDTYLKNPALEYAAPELLTNWQTVFNFNLGWSQDDFKYAHSVWPRFSEFTKLLYDSGVHLTAGSDANNPWIVPGESFHTELELLVKAGIPEKEVIAIATRNGAELLGIQNNVGTISPAKRADIVLLKNNPYDDIRSTRQIIWVMQNGSIK